MFGKTKKLKLPRPKNQKTKMLNQYYRILVFVKFEKNQKSYVAKAKKAKNENAGSPFLKSRFHSVYSKALINNVLYRHY